MEFLAALHPKITHFPIVLLLSYVVLEIISAFSKKEIFSKAAHITLLLGVLTAFLAVLTGNQAVEVADKLKEAGASIPSGVIEKHEDFANLTIWYFTAVLVFRTYLVLKKKFTTNYKYIFIILALAGSYFLYKAGEYGGKLVYKYGVGTELKKTETKINK